ncbi:MAG TPA: HAMP domain-containing sensor histidine kinase [Longimicrobiales bacterium]
MREGGRDSTPGSDNAAGSNGPVLEPPVPWRGTLLPLAFVFIALIALVVVPLALMERSRSTWREIVDVAEPADVQVDAIEYALVREVAAIRAFLITGDSVFLDRYTRARAEETRAYAPLGVLARRLGGDVPARARMLRTAVMRWHRHVATLLPAAGHMAPAAATDVRLATQEAIYRDALDALVSLDHSIDGAVEVRRARIRADERLEMALTLVLVATALGAAIVVARLGVRLVQMTEHAERRRREVEALTESRARLIRGLGHDLKNPLGVIQNYVVLLESGIKGAVPPAQREVLGRIRRLTGDSLGLVNDLGDLFRAEAGQLTISPGRVDVVETVRDALEENRPAAEAAGLRIGLEPHTAVPAVETDGGRVREILGNLISNAIKYTPAGGEVSASIEVGADGRAPRPGRWIAVGITDTGPGIPADQRERIFDEFQRFGAGAGHAPGTGLGLAISRSIARLLGGDITVESEVGRGSTFTLWLPLERK